MRQQHWALAALMGWAVAGCQTGGDLIGPGVVAAGAKRGFTPPELAAGRQIYFTKCTACHSAEPIGRYSMTEWNEIIPDMSKRTRLTEAERGQLTSYVVAAHSALSGHP